MANLPDYYVEARKLDGLKEIVGSQHEARVVGFFAEAGHAWVKDDETAWCAAFENAMLARAGWKGTGKLTARSFLDWGQRVETEDAREGDIVVIPRGTSEWQGHVTMFVRWANASKTQFVGFGGNQKNSVCEATYSAKGILGVRRPNERLVGKSGRPDGTLHLGMMDNKRVKAMQEQLKRLGYAIVGNADGDFGTFTRDAVLAWKADNGLPLDPEVSPRDLDLMDSSKPRQVSEARSTATTAEVKAVDPAVRSNSTATKVAVGTTATVAAPEIIKQTGVLEALKGAKEQVSMGKDIVTQVADGAKAVGFDLVTFVTSHSSLILLVGLVVVVYFVVKATKSNVKDYQEGRKL